MASYYLQQHTCHLLISLTCLCTSETDIQNIVESIFMNKEHKKIIGAFLNRLVLNFLINILHVTNMQASKEIQKLTAENEKLKYRIAHLIRALNEADSKGRHA